ncbi:HemK methyltransferase member 2 [Perkinsus olseni]|uniref:HemK methyltransferase member 2 n=1 Tax=Perkinsus olseni TaxID=32597 RepID=A0A7J6MG86_PEROL|nr:HemK methyltransferase member 2 [Perkinsus olseni]
MLPALDDGRLQWMVNTLWEALARPQGVEEFVILPVVNDYLIGGVDETDKGLLCSEGHIALSMKALVPLHRYCRRGLGTAVATMRVRYAVVAALTFPDCSDAWSQLATDISQSGAPLLLTVTRLTLLAHPKAGGDAWSFRESVLHTMPVEQWDIPAELNLIEAVALKHDFAYYPWSHFGWLIRQLPPGDYPQIESFLGRMLRQTPRHSAPGHYAAEYFAGLCGLDGLPLVRKVWSMMADEHIRAYEGAAEACCAVVLRVAKASGRGSLGSVLREKMSSIGQLEEAPARVFRLSSKLLIARELRFANAAAEGSGSEETFDLVGECCWRGIQACGGQTNGRAVLKWLGRILGQGHEGGLEGSVAAWARIGKKRLKWAPLRSYEVRYALGYRVPDRRDFTPGVLIRCGDGVAEAVIIDLADNSCELFASLVLQLTIDPGTGEVAELHCGRCWDASARKYQSGIDECEQRFHKGALKPLADGHTEGRLDRGSSLRCIMQKGTIAAAKGEEAVFPLPFFPKGFMGCTVSLAPLASSSRLRSIQVEGNSLLQRLLSSSSPDAPLTRELPEAKADCHANVTEAQLLTMIENFTAEIGEPSMPRPLDMHNLASMTPRIRQATLAGITQDAIARARWAFSVAGLASLALSSPETLRLLSPMEAGDPSSTAASLGFLGRGGVTHPQKLCPMVCGPDVSGDKRVMESRCSTNRLLYRALGGTGANRTDGVREIDTFCDTYCEVPTQSLYVAGTTSVISETEFGPTSIPDGHDGSFPATTFLDPRYLPCVSRSCRATCYISPQSGACVPRAIEGSEGYGILMEFCSSCNSQTQCNDALQSTPALPVKYTSKCDWSLDSCSSLCRASLKHNPVYWALPNTVWDVYTGQNEAVQEVQPCCLSEEALQQSGLGGKLDADRKRLGPLLCEAVAASVGEDRAAFRPCDKPYISEDTVHLFPPAPGQEIEGLMKVYTGMGRRGPNPDINSISADIQRVAVSGKESIELVVHIWNARNAECWRAVLLSYRPPAGKARKSAAVLDGVQSPIYDADKLDQLLACDEELYGDGPKLVTTDGGLSLEGRITASSASHPESRSGVHSNWRLYTIEATVPSAEVVSSGLGSDEEPYRLMLCFGPAQRYMLSTMDMAESGLPPVAVGIFEVDILGRNRISGR